MFVDFFANHMGSLDFQQISGGRYFHVDNDVSITVKMPFYKYAQKAAAANKPIHILNINKEDD